MKILSNNPTRGSENWSHPSPGARRLPTIRGPKLSIRRLIKRDPNKGTSLPMADVLVDTHGVSGLSGASNARVMGNTESRQTSFGTGKTVIRTDGRNKSLKKR